MEGRRSAFLPLLLLTFLLGCLTAHAATITVTSSLDNGDPGTLRDAIDSAAGGDTIVFQAGLASPITLTDGELYIDKDLTIIGPGATKLTISGDDSSRVFYIDSGDVTIRGLTIANGYYDGDGGGIYIYEDGGLTLDQCQVKNCYADDDGGGIYNDGDLTITNSSLTYNEAEDCGGAIEHVGDSLIIENSTLSGNYADSDGGAISHDGSNMTLVSVTIANNESGGDGGGVWGDDEEADVGNSIIADNHADDSGPDWYGYFYSTGYNFIGDSDGLSDVNGDWGSCIFDEDPDLAPLALNGGTTLTQALRPGSMAIAAGDPDLADSTDQRGVTRRADAVDMGACQTGGFTVPRGTLREGQPITLGATAADPGTGITFSYAWHVTKDGLDYASATDGPGLGATDSFTFTPDDNGTYVITLTVTDSEGISIVSPPQTVTVVNVAPAASNVAVTPDTINEGDSVTLSGTIRDPGTLDWFTLSVNWGDGSAAQDFHLDAGSTSFSLQHTYVDNPSSGPTYSIGVRLTDKDGANAVGSDIGGVVNADFEDGLNGWTVETDGIADVSASAEPLLPQSGSYFLLMDAGSMDGTTDTGAYSGLCGDGVVRDGTEGTVVTQSFSLPAGATVSFQWNYLTDESQGSQYDFAIGDLLDGGMNVVAYMFEANSSISDDAAGSGYERQSGWQTASFTASVAGTYTLRFVVTNTVDNEVNSGLAVDNITVVMTGPPLLTNGGFETGDYTGWTLLNPSENGTWGTAGDGETINPADSTYDFSTGTSVNQTSVGLPITYYPTEGRFMAYLLENGAGTYRMYQDVTLPANAIALTWDMSYNNHSDDFYDDQYIAVHIRDTADNILQTVFMTNPGDPLTIPMTGFSADLTPFAGQTVRLDVECDIEDWYCDVAFDRFAIASAITVAVTVNNVAPTIVSTGVPAGILPGGQTTFHPVITDPGTPDTFTYAWTVTQPDGTPVTMSGAAPSFTATQDGTYTVVLTVTDDDGGQATATSTMKTGPASASGSSLTGPVPLTVIFAGGPDGASYLWDFGDGTTSTLQNPSHTYTVPGTYTVTLTVTAENGVTSSATLTVMAFLNLSGAVDSDGDGYYDEIELALGSDPNNFASTPLAQAPLAKLNNLYAVKTNIRLSFARPQGNDSIAMVGVFHIPAGFNIAGQVVIVDVGGVVKAFTLDAKGASPKGNDSLAVRVKAPGAAAGLYEAKFSLALKKGTYAATLATYGLENKDVLKGLTAPATMIFNGELLQKELPLIYRGHKGRTGLAR